MTQEQRIKSLSDALAHLQQARELREYRAKIVRACYGCYEERGPLISGCEQEHWPEAVKEGLRKNARMIASEMDSAVKAWRKAGKRIHTFQRLAESYRVEGSRY